MNNHINGAYGADDIDARLEAFRRSDANRESLIQDIVRKYRDLQEQYRYKCDDLESEIMSRRQLQSLVNDLKREVAVSRQQTESNAFVLALIDGDGAIFHDKFLTAAGEGGSEAGHMLFNEMKQHIQARHPHASASWPIMVQIYCNFEGLSRKLAQLGIIRAPGDFLAFAREFNLSQPLFSMVDVGSGKERADHKIKEMLRLYISNIQCKDLIFGGCHDNGYLVSFLPFQHDQTVVERMTLLETTPAEPYKQLKFHMTCFPSIFRNESLPGIRPTTVPAVSFSPQPVSPQLGSARASTPPTSSGNYGAPPTRAASITPSSYASVGGVEGIKDISIAPAKPVPTPKHILLNAYDQRLDEHLLKVDAGTMASLSERIARQKICNYYHLLGNCTNGKLCQYQHGKPLSTKELLALRHKARGLCCPRGSDCRDFDCHLGHVCRGNASCTFEQCFFGDLHDIDTTPALKQYEDGRVVPLNERVSR